MSVTVSITLSDGDAARVNAAAVAAGFANGKQWAISLVKIGVAGYEQQRALQAAIASMNSMPLTPT